MRRQSLVAAVVLTATIATLVALPGAAGSQTTSTARQLTAEAFQQVRLPASDDGSPLAIRQLDAGNESAGHIDNTAPLIETGDYAPPAGRPTVLLPAAVLRTVQATPTPKIVARPAVARKPAPASKATSRPVIHRIVAKPPVPRVVARPTSGFKRVLTGLASWYDNGTTAMRLPYGTHIRICGVKGCISRTVRDWGPARYLSNRVVDMIPADFVLVTGRHLTAGLAPVQVYIY